MKIRRTILAALTVIVTGAAGSAMAQQPGRILSGYPAGGAVDILARVYADALTKEFGRPFIVENKSGAGGLLACEALKAAPPDGLTLMLAPDSNIIFYPHTVKKPSYDGVRDFAAVAPVASYDMGFGVKKDPRITDFKSFAATAKTDRSIASFGSPGQGSMPHFYGLLVGQAIGTELTHVAYRGVVPSINDMVAGVLPSVATPIGNLFQHAKAGNLRIVATSAEQRTPKAPDVPTFKELGYPQLSHSGWFGLFAPAGTPPEMIARINDVITKSLRTPAVLNALSALEMDPRPMTAPEFAALVKSDNERWAKVIKASGFSAD
jgi:tripartite-type tricarboxylate transporter receptor subunit TctC